MKHRARQSFSLSLISVGVFSSILGIFSQKAEAWSVSITNHASYPISCKVAPYGGMNSQKVCAEYESITAGEKQNFENRSKECEHYAKHNGLLLECKEKKGGTETNLKQVPLGSNVKYLAPLGKSPYLDF